MKKFILVDTWNGEGYSEPEVKVFNHYDAMEQAYNELQQEYANQGMDLTINEDSFIYEQGDDAGCVHQIEIEETTIIKIMPDMNEVEIIVADDDAELNFHEMVINESYEETPFKNDYEHGHTYYGEHAADGFVAYQLIKV